MISDIVTLRELAMRVAELAADGKQTRRRELWRAHNALNRVGTPIYVRDGGWSDEVIAPELTCADPFYRGHEAHLRKMIFQDEIGDDFIIEPWITQHAHYVLPENGHWGLNVNVTRSGVSRGAFHQEPSLKDPSDFDKMIAPKHVIDAEKTAQSVQKIGDAVGDILPINLSRAPFWRMWTGDISTDLGYLRGIENFMWDMYDNPDWLHKVAAFMRDGILNAHEQAEIAGDWHYSDSENQTMPYSDELHDPIANGPGALRSQIWGYMAAQEFTCVSPAMFNEFLLEYQIPILSKFGLTAYGCCEDLTEKLPYIMKIPNLRRIGVTPFSNMARCAEQIGDKYVCSWRPNPSSTVSAGFDEDNVYRLIKDAARTFKRYNCVMDICLKDVHTVGGDKSRLKRFVDVVRRAIGG